MDVTDWLTVYGGGGIFENSITSRISNPTIVNALGETTAAPFASLQNRHSHTEQAGFRASVDTGPIHHDINFNTTLITGQLDTSRVNGTLVTSNIYNPRPAPFQALPLPAAANESRKPEQLWRRGHHVGVEEPHPVHGRHVVSRSKPRPSTR